MLRLLVKRFWGLEDCSFLVSADWQCHVAQFLHGNLFFKCWLTLKPLMRIMVFFTGSTDTLSSIAEQFIQCSRKFDLNNHQRVPWLDIV